ncbi:MAG TPA: flagellar basal body-associated FliL family protein [Kineosporiaceae bacterium]|jgi:flagellar FliL protein|nr:flagellar basal body-associated FliL family protein [Kineosporiaceae bacterium]
MATKTKDPDTTTDGDGDKKKGGLGGKLKLIAMILPTLLLIGGAVYMFVLKPSSSTSAETAAKSSAAASAEEGTDSGEGDASESTPTSTFVAGKIIVMDTITINLANGHFLKVGLGLQATADAGEEVTTSKAMDAAITEFSGKTVDELATQAGRDAAKKELTKAIKKAYEKKVYEIFYTTFVMQ